MTTPTDGAPALVDADGRVVAWTDEMAARTDYEADEVLGEPLSTLLRGTDGDRAISDDVLAAASEHGSAATDAALVGADGSRMPVRVVATPVAGGDVPAEFVVAVRDPDDRAELERLNALVRGIDRALVDATDRAAVETAVVERLADTEGYEGAIVGDFTSSFSEFYARAWAGFDADDPSRYFPPTADGTPAVTAVRSRTGEETAVNRPDGDDAPGGDDLTALFVPLAKDDQVYGVLGVYRTGGFGDRERTVLLELGETIGDAIHAAGLRELVYAESVVEVELRSRDADDPFAAASAATDCRIELDAHLPTADGRCLYYVRVGGCDPEPVATALTDRAAVVGCRVVSTEPEAAVVEVEATGPTVTCVLSDHGARAVDVVADGGRLDVVAEVAPGTDVRRLVEGVRSQFPDAELLARREVDRSVETWTQFRDGVFDALTDKQRTALEAAFYAGYFDWPRRDSSAADVAATLGVARQTFQQHLRIAQRKLLSAFFEGRP